MKNLQQNLLIVVVFSLCGLCVYQWYGQTLQRNEIQTLDQTVYEKSVAILGYTNSIRTMDRQIAEMDARITELKVAVKTNADLVNAQRRDLNQLQINSEGLTNIITQYKGAVTDLQTKLKEAYDGIQKQNEAIKELVSQRDELVKKFNDEVKDRNDVVNKYNELVRQVEKNQAASTRQ
jgi:chromosome segregation ATPase